MIGIIIVVIEVIKLVSNVKKVNTKIHMVISFIEMVNNVTTGVYRLV